MLLEAQLAGLTDIIMAGVEGLAGQAAPSGSALNDKFQKSGEAPREARVCPPVVLSHPSPYLPPLTPPAQASF